MSINGLEQVQIDGILIHDTGRLGTDREDLDIVSIKVVANDLESWDDGR